MKSRSIIRSCARGGAKGSDLLREITNKAERDLINRFSEKLAENIALEALEQQNKKGKQ